MFKKPREYKKLKRKNL